MIGKRHYLALVLLLSCISTSSSYAQSLPYERVLFPLLILNGPIPGGYGSQWTTDVRVLNRSTGEVKLYGSFVCFMCDSRYGDGHFVPDVSFKFLPWEGRGGIPGAFLLIDRSGVGDVVFELRARDLSRDDRSFGTEIPVVREAAFSPSRIDLLGVPVDSRFRRNLRVYSLDSIGGTFRVRVYAEKGTAVGSSIPAPDPLLGEQTYTMIQPPDGGDRENYPAFSGVGEIPFIETAGEVSSVRIEITPLTTGLRIWGFVSVTNNDTQEVTIVSPQ